jgi:hypothetical protein
MGLHAAILNIVSLLHEILGAKRIPGSQQRSSGCQLPFGASLGKYTYTGFMRIEFLGSLYQIHR